MWCSSKIAGLFLSLAAASAAAQPDAEAVPPYVDEQGEEVFGLGYIPRSPEDGGAPLLVGRPGGGAVVDGARATLRQNEFGTLLGGPAPVGVVAPPAALPLLKSVRDSRRIGRWSGPQRTVPFPETRLARAATREMTVHFVYVGNGAGAILEFPCGVAVVDSGGEYQSETNGGKLFLDYLDRFFDARPALNRTIDVLFTSHPHKDHLYGLASMKLGGADGFVIRNIVDNGQTGTEGSLKVQTDRRKAVRNQGANYSAVEFGSQTFATGATNAVIDPIACPVVDPKLTAFWGGRNEQLSAGSGTARRYTTPNNHSVVLRVDFGKASLLFLGDLQAEGAADLLDEYEDNLGAFDVDVFLASHHGAANGTSDRLIQVMSPKIAVISMGDKSSTKPSTAFDHGHPRLDTIALMQEQPEVVSGTRTPVTFWGAPAQETPFEDVRITRAIYGTGWEGTLLLKMKSDGTYRFVTP